MTTEPPIAPQTRTSPTGKRSGLRHWPLDRTAWAHAAAVGAVATTLLALLGVLVVHVLEDGAFGRADRRVSEWFEDQRTPRLEDLGQIASGLSDTLTVIPVCMVLVAGFAIAWRRWHESILVVGALLYEKAIFLPVTLIADRERPPIGQLDGDPPSSSFFSGHVAAAVSLYFGLYLVVTWHTRSRAVRAVAGLIATFAVLAVASSRLLLGMHYISDVVVGATVGVLSLVVVRAAIFGSERRSQAAGGSRRDGESDGERDAVDQLHPAGAPEHRDQRRPASAFEHAQHGFAGEGQGDERERSTHA
jgi:membrane-associated phospholipid phosphatase